MAVRGPVAAALLVVALLIQHAYARSKVSKLTDGHFTSYGARLPAPDFSAALRAAAVDISHLSCRTSLVILGMANEEALRTTVPLFLKGLSKVLVETGKQKGQRMDGKVVLVAWSQEALAMCEELQSKDGYKHKCVLDQEHKGSSVSMGFHSSGFNALGFAKIKYILNGLSLGHDVVFLDTDIVLLRDPVPYFMSRGADTFGAHEKCLFFNDTLAFHSKEFIETGVRIPPINIGILYFKATAAITRCVYNWLWDMHEQAPGRPNVWDQDIYGKVIAKCAAVHSLRWQVLDPRLFQSACFPQCGCTFDDAEVTRAKLGSFSRGHKFLPNNTCGPQHWGSSKAAGKGKPGSGSGSGGGAGGSGALPGPYPSDGWILRHYACSGATADKAHFMGNMMAAYYEDGTAVITRRTDPEPRRRGRRRGRALAEGAGAAGGG